MKSQSINGIILAALSFPTLAFAGSPVTDAKLIGFKSAVAKLNSDIGNRNGNTFQGGFLELVDKCNPPALKKDLLDGFSDPAKPTSAKALLAVHEKDVSDHVAAADLGFDQIKKATLACMDKAPLVAQAQSTANAAQENLAKDLALYKNGVDEANRKRPMVEKILKARRGMIEAAAKIGVSPDKIPGLPPGSVEACDAAVKQISVMEASNSAVQLKLIELHNSYPERARAEEVAINAPNSCGPVKKASLDSNDSSPEGREASEVSSI